MALNRGNLGFTSQVSAATTGMCYTVGSAQTAFVKGILIYNLDTGGVQNVKIHVVPNNGGAVGLATSTTQVARLGIGTDDTFFFEPPYPIPLNSNGDSLQVQNEGVADNSVNVFLLGDKEV